MVYSKWHSLEEKAKKVEKAIESVGVDMQKREKKEKCSFLFYNNLGNEEEANVG